MATTSRGTPRGSAVVAVNRYRVAPEDQDGFLADAGPALGAFAGRPGFVDGHVGRSTDDPALWVMVTRWESVGAYRRALSAYDVKVLAVPLMYRAVDEPGAYEVLSSHDGVRASTSSSDLAAGAADSLEDPGGHREGP